MGRASGMIAIFPALLFAGSVEAEEPGNRALGLSFALAHCASCHAVTSEDKSSPNPKAPSFESVAKTSGMTGLALAAWLDTSHPTMPNFILKSDDRDNIVAYILSLNAK